MIYCPFLSVLDIIEKYGESYSIYLYMYKDKFSINFHYFWRNNCSKWPYNVFLVSTYNVFLVSTYNVFLVSTFVVRWLFQLQNHTTQRRYGSFLLFSKTIWLWHVCGQNNLPCKFQGMWFWDQECNSNICS